MKRLLITGATGFIGRHCLSLACGHEFEVHAVSSRLAERQESVTMHQVDLHVAADVMQLLHDVQPTHLLHLAWFVKPGAFWTSTENMRWLQTSLQLLDAFVMNGGQRVVMAGTCAEYDWNYGYCSERTTPLVPRMLYGTCKHALQLALHMYAQQTGLSAAWGRVFFPYGPHEPIDKLVASVTRALLEHRPVHTSHGLQIRDFLHVTDVAGAFIAMLESDVVGPVNIGSGHPVSIREVLTEIAQHTGSEELIELGARQVAPDEPPLLVADVRRLTNEVGWKPKHTLRTGIEETVSWWRTQLDNAYMGIQ